MEERRLLVAVALSLLRPDRLQHAVSADAAPAARGPAAAGARPRLPPAAPAAGATSAARRRHRAASPFRRPRPSPAMADEHERRVEMSSAGRDASPSRTGARASSRGSCSHFDDARGRPEEMVQAARDGPAPARPRDRRSGARRAPARGALPGPRPRASAWTGRTRRRCASSTRRATSRRRRSSRFAAGAIWCRSRPSSVAMRPDRAGTKILWGPGVGNPTADRAGGPGIPAAAGGRPAGRRSGALAAGEAAALRSGPRGGCLGGRREPLLRGPLRSAGRRGRGCGARGVPARRSTTASPARRRS